MITQMGDYQIPAPRIIPEYDANCQICRGYGTDYQRFLLVCSCARYFNPKHDKEFDHWDYLNYMDTQGYDGLKRLAKEWQITTREQFITMVRLVDERRK